MENPWNAKNSDTGAAAPVSEIALISGICIAQKKNSLIWPYSTSSMARGVMYLMQILNQP